jgi:heat shock protein HslJ
VPDGHSSRNALDWAGTYSGVLPCASCPGIETTVTLGQDGSFERRMAYIDESPLPAVETGRFEWDEAGRSITASGDGFETQRYQVGENVLFHLDRDGKRIEGELAGHYVLLKHIQDPRLEDRHWTLIELRGQPVEPAEDGREAFLFLRAEDGRVHGNASCNRFNGGYAIKTGQRIDFGRNMAMTMMACPDMQLEQAFIEVLQTADNYSLGDDGTMTLNRARMAPLARFVESTGTV